MMYRECGMGGGGKERLGVSMVIRMWMIEMKGINGRIGLWVVRCGCWLDVFV
jgi:hypothetical protein